MAENPRSVVDEQAEDEGLWFIPETITEDHLQRALRRLHAAVEGKSPEECVRGMLSAAGGKNGNGLRRPSQAHQGRHEKEIQQMKDAVGIDEKCYELARHFLQDLYASSGDEQHLASEFQEIAEDFCRELEAKNKKEMK